MILDISNEKKPLKGKKNKEKLKKFHIAAKLSIVLGQLELLFVIDRGLES